MALLETFHIYPDGRAHLPGCNFGPGKDPLTLHTEDRGTVVLKNKGFTGWAGTGSKDYYPAQFRVYTKVDEHVDATTGTRMLTLMHVTTFDINQKKDKR